MTKKNICIVTGTRAEYGLLKWVIDGVKKSEILELKIIATGMHLSPEFGLTYKEIESDGFKIDKKVEMLLSSDTPSGIIKSMGVGMIALGDYLVDLNPDLIIVLGDRYEIFVAASAAMIARIPVAHLHGGESTEGLIDEPIRHSITKMSHLHFVSTEKYKKRVLQLGEKAENVFLVGGLGVDSIQRTKLFSKTMLQDSLNFKFGAKNILVTYHPVTLEKNTSQEQMAELLNALNRLENTKIIFTMPNADTDGRILFSMIKKFTKKHPNSIVFTSLGQKRYFSCLKYVDAVIGNSSSGLLEAPSFKIGTINIGDRQKGRVKAKSIINCEPKEESIFSAINRLYSKNFQNMLPKVVNPYGEGGASNLIIKIIEKISLNNIIKKKFIDLEIN